jgi:hypothetical protein
MVGMEDGKSFGQIIIYRADVFSVFDGGCFVPSHLNTLRRFYWHSGWDGGI